MIYIYIYIYYFLFSYVFIYFFIHRHKEGREEKVLYLKKKRFLVKTYLSEGFYLVSWSKPLLRASECILDETDCIWHSTNTLGKGMNPIILPPAMGK